MDTIHVSASKQYDVLIGEGLLDRSGELTRKVVRPCKCVIVTDDTVDELYGDRVQISFSYSGFEVTRFAFPAGEASKSLDTLAGLLNAMGEAGLSRSDLVVALGGGVVGDLAGFAAAIYARGIRFVQVPTTLLAAVDSSVGGKTAVDMPFGKNMVGAFHQPELVITDTDVLRECPRCSCPTAPRRPSSAAFSTTRRCFPCWRAATGWGKSTRWWRAAWPTSGTWWPRTSSIPAAAPF